MTRMCAPCRASHAAWLDYRLPPAPIRLVNVGVWRLRDVSESRRARFEEWRSTIRWQQALIQRLCAADRHAAPTPASLPPIVQLDLFDLGGAA